MKSERFAEAGLNGFQHLVGRHSRGQAHRHGGDQQRQEGVQLRHQNHEEQKQARVATVRTMR